MNFAKVSDGYGICGAIKGAGSEPPGFKSYVRVTPEADNDAVLPPTIKADLALPLGGGLYSIGAGLRAAKAMTKLPKPTLCVCASGRRAGAMTVVAMAIENDWDVETAMQFAKDQSMTFVDNSEATNWVVACVLQHQRAELHDLIFHQLFEKESSTFTYILADGETGEGVIIDPVDLCAERDFHLSKEMGIKLIYGINTHCHADHITGTHKLKLLDPGIHSMISKASSARADKHFAAGDKIVFGNRWLEVRSTPGHTDGCCTFVLDDRSMAFTGDALLIRGCGRTDFQGGSSDKLFDSVHSEIFSLPCDTVLYPAHDYQGRSRTTVSEERQFNPRLTKTKEEFKVIMDELGLPKPKKIDVAVPANLMCGVYEMEEG